MPSLLIIDDEPEILEATKWFFETNGYTVYSASSGEEGLQVLQNSNPDVLIVDYKLPGMSGVEFLKALKGVNPAVPAILLTGLTQQSEVLEEECRRLGAFALLNKPLEMSRALQVVKEALRGGASPPSDSV